MEIKGPGLVKFTLRRQHGMRKSERSRTDYWRISSFGSQVEEKEQGKNTKGSLRMEDKNPHSVVSQRTTE